MEYFLIFVKKLLNLKLWRSPTRVRFPSAAVSSRGSRVGTSSGGFDFRDDGNAGGARDAWGLGVGSGGQIGHGPGPGS